MPSLREEMEILLKKYPDPRKGVTGLLEFQKKENTHPFGTDGVKGRPL